jgi:hypothetical protein
LFEPLFLDTLSDGSADPIVASIGNCWPTIIEASFDPVDFITTLRTMFMSIKMAFGVESEALRISVSNGIQFWSGVW